MTIKLVITVIFIMAITAYVYEGFTKSNIIGFGSACSIITYVIISHMESSKTSKLYSALTIILMWILYFILIFK